MLLDVFGLMDVFVLDRLDIYEAARRVTPNIVYFVPRNIDQMQMVALAEPGKLCEIEENRAYSRCKTITAYYGELVNEGLEVNEACPVLNSLAIEELI